MPRTDMDGLRHAPSYLVAEAGHRPTVEALLAAGADVNATDLQGRTPTGLAVQNGHEDVVELLRQYLPRPPHPGSWGRADVLATASRHGEVERGVA